MQIRRTIVEADTSTLNVTSFCEELGVSRWFFYDLRRRFAEDGEAVFEPASRTPKRLANKTPAWIEDMIVTERKRLVETGWDAGAETISVNLDHVEGLPSVSTIWRILKARGFITDEPAKAPRKATRRFCAARANESWQVDDTTWVMADGTVTKILNGIDDHSRLLVACTAMTTCTGAGTLAALADAATVLGWPQRVQSDNAQAFKHVLKAALLTLGVNKIESGPYHPQTNGKVERFHQTLKKWLATQPPARSLQELQAQLDLFKLAYNTVRRHRAIDSETPSTRWIHAPKSGPDTNPQQAPPRAFTNTVKKGRVSAGGRARISVGSEHNGEPATAIITPTNTCYLFINGALKRRITNYDTTKHTYALRSNQL